MSQATSIEWCDVSSNPVKFRDAATGKDVWACVKHSPGCKNCYAEAIANRFDRGGPFTRTVMDGVQPHLCEHEVRSILRKRSLAGKRVFIGDMTDVFGEWVTDRMLDTLFCAMAIRTDVTFQVLTKRADRLEAYMRTPERKRTIASCTMQLSNMLASQEQSHAARLKLTDFDRAFLESGTGPFPNIWIGVSVEDQQRADERVPCLLRTPAAVRFLSVEPLLGPVNFGTWLNNPVVVGHPAFRGDPNRPAVADPLLHWVIVGGESGPDARPLNPKWARSLRDQCQTAGVAFYLKQMGSLVEGPGLKLIRTSGKGGGLQDIPEDLRIREFPKVPG